MPDSDLPFLPSQPGGHKPRPTNGVYTVRSPSFNASDEPRPNVGPLARTYQLSPRDYANLVTIQTAANRGGRRDLSLTATLSLVLANMAFLCGSPLGPDGEPLGPNDPRKGVQ